MSHLRAGLRSIPYSLVAETDIRQRTGSVEESNAGGDNARVVEGRGRQRPHQAGDDGRRQPGKRRAFGEQCPRPRDEGDPKYDQGGDGNIGPRRNAQQRPVQGNLTGGGLDDGLPPLSFDERGQAPDV